MSEAIIVRGGIAAGGETVDLSGINASLSSINGSILSINTRINQINNNVASLWDTVNNISNGALGTATNTIIIANGYYNCTKTGNYWIEVVGGGGGGYSARVSAFWSYSGGGSGYINNGSIRLNNGDSIYVTIGEGGKYANSGGTTSFGPYKSAYGGNIGDYYSAGVGANNGQYAQNYTNEYGNVAIGGWLYYDTSNRSRVSATGSIRLYYGDGGVANRRNLHTLGSGNSGCVIITYMD